MRLTKAELDKIKEKYGVDELWSWSRLDKAMTSKNEFYLNYIKHEKEDRLDCVYAPMGGLCHDTLEKLYESKIQYDEMEEYFSENWITLIDIMGLKFDRNDSDKNLSIGSKYRDNLFHFFAHHTMIPYKVVVEKFILTNFDGTIFQGYADAIFKDDTGDYNIIDFKTSTKYSPSVQNKKCGQLVCYALGLHQMMNIPLEQIKIAWNFLKYVTVKYEQANGKITSRDIERKDIGIKLQSTAKMWLKKFGYEDKIDSFLDDKIRLNSIETLPEEVKQKFEITDCYTYVPLTDDLINYWKDVVNDTVKEIEELTKQYEEKIISDPEHAEEVWYDSIEDVEKESYYYATLSGYSASLNKSYARYLDYLEAKKNGTDLFADVGSDLDILELSMENMGTDNKEDNNEIDDKRYTKGDIFGYDINDNDSSDFHSDASRLCVDNIKSEEDNEEDMSWLDLL